MIDFTTPRRVRAFALSKKAELMVRIGLPSVKHSEAISLSMRPDLKTIPEHRARIEVKTDGSDLLLRICAQDATALKSSMNSTLRTISAMINVLEQLERPEGERSPRGKALDH